MEMVGKFGGCWENPYTGCPMSLGDMGRSGVPGELVRWGERSSVSSNPLFNHSILQSFNLPRQPLLLFQLQQQSIDLAFAFQLMKAVFYRIHSEHGLCTGVFGFLPQDLRLHPVQRT